MPRGEEWGRILIEEKLIIPEQLQKALAAARKTEQPLEEALVDLGFLTKEEVYSFIAKESGIPYLDLSNYIVDPEVVKLIPEELVTKYTLFPIFKIGNTLTVAMSDPTNFLALDEVKMESNCEIEACVSSISDIKMAIEQSYETTSSMEILIKSMGKEEATGVGAIADISGEAPITKLVDLIIAQAARDRASDIHIEPDEDILRIRFRIDGVLYEIPSPPKHSELAIISRIKVLSSLDIATTRIPQDGHIKTSVDGKEIDIRVSTIPTVYGENLVLRLLSASSALFRLEQLGFSADALEKFEEMISRPWGIILSTGPTGSGKTTTLYASLNRINSMEKNIITIEDPVEYHLDLIRQIQVAPKVGLTFATGLRSIVRQDPDIVMVGEIRDLEAADISIQAALTGHLVFSTLHTNDAPSSVIRLVDMGVAPFLIAGSFTGVIAQRLVRKICAKCKESYKPSKALLSSLEIQKKDVSFSRGKGCRFCKGTGYKGRVALFELMLMSDKIRDLITANAPVTALRKQAEKEGMKGLKEDGLGKALAGITSIEEVARVTEARIDIGRKEEIPLEKKIAAQKEEKVGVAPLPLIKSGVIRGIQPEKADDARAPSFVSKTMDLREYREKIANWLAKK